MRERKHKSTVACLIEGLGKQIKYLIREVKKMSAEMDKLEQEVREMKDAAKAGAKVIRSLGALIKANIDNKPRLLELAAELNTDAEDLAAATLENTPADPNAETTPA